MVALGIATKIVQVRGATGSRHCTKLITHNTDFRVGNFRNGGGLRRGSRGRTSRVNAENCLASVNCRWSEVSI